MYRRSGEQPLDGVVLPFGERAVELCDVAEQRRLGQELADEGVHRLSDALEREHLRNQQVHDVGLDAGAVLEWSGLSARTLFDGAVITVFDGRRSSAGTMGADHLTHSVRGCGARVGAIRARDGSNPVPVPVPSNS